MIKHFSLAVAAAAVCSVILSGQLYAKQAAAPGNAVLRSTIDDAPHFAWRKALSQLPAPAAGCFTATYPRAVWEPSPCTAAPNQPYPPAQGSRPDVVGNGHDFSAKTAKPMSSAFGGFASFSGVKSEEGGSGSKWTKNSFSLQLNTNTFHTSACKGAASPNACRGWQQFIYGNGGGSVFMQYWLIGYVNRCPSGWNSYHKDCWRNGPGKTVHTRTAKEMVNLVLDADADSGKDAKDSVRLDYLDSSVLVKADDSVLGLSRGWKAAEFNVFGDCCGSEAKFNSGSTIVVHTSSGSGPKNPPSCLEKGYTGETNNLNLVDTPTVDVSEGSPFSPLSYIQFKESNHDKGTAACPS